MREHHRAAGEGALSRLGRRKAIAGLLKSRTLLLMHYLGICLDNIEQTNNMCNLFHIFFW